MPFCELQTATTVTVSSVVHRIKNVPLFNGANTIKVNSPDETTGLQGGNFDICLYQLNFKAIICQYQYHANNIIHP